MDVATVQTPNPLDAGWQALGEGAWEDARVHFMAALGQEETATALEGLGWAAWWLNDVPVTFDARERAYRRYREDGDNQAAARMAVSLAADHFLRRGEHAVADGWFQRAHRLLDGLDPSPEHAMLAIWESYVAVIFHHDTAKARQLGAEARALAGSLGVIDLEMLAQASLGFAMVCEGNIAEGMRLLDGATAAAVAGEMTDPDAIVTTCCYLISACERVRDYDRAAQWCERAIRLADRWSYRFMFAYCRSHYAGVLIWRGAWPDAEAELEAATGELAATFPAMAAEGITRLAELRRRQGRFEDAHALLDRLDAQPLRALGSKPALLGRAALALDQGDLTTAIDLAERFLRGVPSEDRVERIDGLELLARAQATHGDHALASRSMAELRVITEAIATPSLQAMASHVEGVIEAARGDYDEARRRFEDAVDLFDAGGAPFEAACSRLELADALAAVKRPDAAAREARVALTILEQIGAARELERAAALLRHLEAATPDRAGNATAAAGLTHRELEILGLVAQGLSDKEVATTLRLSEHTIHRHVSNILNKLDVPSRTAAVAQAVQHGLL
ncbi:MAG: regulatory protein LuxR [Thermomicrobiales bacterium]|jgi:ATP/maltotriose-dependent transcriptional regulator MalT|nr:regulatory protein LuxR [Thermomicrobiales bacterium]MCD6056865.1 regulatory protein LuxR [Thermomicrobiales bacterium]MDF2759355.1 regulatory protein LuxR [Thermomicrobiales bacterium]MDF3016774.1 regulatory protein LuxR [Thermomicrobiales bacterium]